MDLDLYIRAHQYLAQLEGRETRETREEDLPPCGGPCHACAERGLLCGGGRSTFAIDWKGTLLPCDNLDWIRAYPLKDGFAEAWTRINREAENYPRVPECEGCAYRKVCFSCAAVMHQYADPGKQPAELCEIVRYYVQHGVVQLPPCEDPSV